jgi:3-dehydroquinate dehydratase-2
VVQSLLILNGPGLDKLGEIARDQYGAATLADIRSLCGATGAALGYEIDFRQSNDTGEVLKWAVNAGDAHAGIVINPAIATGTEPQLETAYIAIMHALGYVKLPTIEVHLSNVFMRGHTEHPSYISTVSLGLISGFGMHGYELAIKALAGHLSAKPMTIREDLSI